jgi:ribosomal protein S12 methylthiotransferase
VSSTAARPRRIAVVSLGCAKNLVDTEVMLGHLERGGWELVTETDGADVVLVNTCGFIEAAREESIRAILEAASLKREAGLQRVVVAGCMVQRYREELERELPEVDAFIGLDELHLVTGAAGADAAETSASPAVRSHSRLPVLGRSAPVVAEAGGAAPSAVAAWGAATYLYDDATPRRTATPPWTAYVKISEGCDHTCSFCAIPSFRGRFRSREAESIVREVRGLAEAGVKEINLVAQDSSHYGRDRGDRNGLAGLLESLDGVEGIRWIRVHYLYPNTVTDRLIEAMATLPRVVPYVDLPLQHAHRETLSRMRRGGSADSHLRLLDRFRRAMPEASLRTTFIVGFPGETDEEFESLLRFVDEAAFDHVGVFTYSHEQGTTALEFRDDVPQATKDQRHETLMARQQPIAFRHNADAVGRRIPVLVEGPHPETEHLLVGRSAGQAADVDGQVLLNDGWAAPGDLVRVDVTDTAGYDLVGRIVDPA